jgi:hypothetical protein
MAACTRRLAQKKTAPVPKGTEAAIFTLRKGSSLSGSDP